MPTRLMQASFTGGELDPALHSRVELSKYMSGLARCYNFFVHPQGGASNRPGTTLVAEVKDSTKRVRLIPFIYSNGDAYILEFGEGYIRIVRAGGQIVDAGVVVEVATQYLESELFDIDFVQSGDVVTLVHQDSPQAQLSRSSHVDWALDDLVFDPILQPPVNLVVVPTSAGTAKDHEYVVTSYSSDTLEESIASAEIVQRGANILSSDSYNTITWDPVDGADTYYVYKRTGGVYGFIGSADSEEFVDDGFAPDTSDSPPQARNPFDGVGNYPSAVTYHEQRLVFAASATKKQTIWFSRTGNFHNFSISSPQKADDAITVAINSNTVNKIRYLTPMTDLIVFTAGAEHKVTSGDAAFSFENMRRTPEGELGAAQVKPVVVGKSILFVQGRGGVVRDYAYKLDSDGYSGNDLSVMAKHLFIHHDIVQWAFAQEPYGILWVVRDDGIMLGLTYLREHDVWAWHQHETDGFVESVAVIPEGREDVLYLVVRRTIEGVDRRYIERMHTRKMESVEDAYFVDCGLTYDGNAEQPAVAASTLYWWRPPFSSGEVDLVQVNTLSHDGDDTTALVMDTNMQALGDNLHVLDLGEGATPGMLRLVASVQGTTNIGVVVYGYSDTFDTADTQDPWGSDYLTMQGSIGSFDLSTPTPVDLDFTGVTARYFWVDVKAPSEGIIDSLSLFEFGTPVSTSGQGGPVTDLSGLDHLEGKEVAILADGNVHPRRVVENGAITLDYPATVVHVGLPYSAELETLELPAEGKYGSKRSTSRLQVRVKETRGLWAGPTTGQPRELKQRTTEAWGQAIALETSDHEIVLEPTWEAKGKIRLSQVDPLPATVLSILPEES